MNLGAASRQFVGGMEWSLWALAKSVGVSAASVARAVR